jgi:hypothetical protein
MMKHLVSFLFFMTLSSTVLANGLTERVVGIRQNKSVWDSTGSVSSNDKVGVQFGALGYSPWSDTSALRWGILFTMRNAEIEDNVSTLTANRYFLDVPLTANFNLNESFEAYGGAILALKVSSSCDYSLGTCSSLNDENSLLFIPTLGFNVKSNNLKYGLFYEMDTTFSKFWKQNALGISFAWTM